MSRNPANRISPFVLGAACPVIVFALVVAAPANSVDDGAPSGGSEELVTLAPEGSLSTTPSSGAGLEEASPDPACGCCFDEFVWWPLKGHVMYASAYVCPRGGAKRALKPGGAHAHWKWGSCYQGNTHDPCSVAQ